MNFQSMFGTNVFLRRVNLIFPRLFIKILYEEKIIESIQ